MTACEMRVYISLLLQVDDGENTGQTRAVSPSAYEDPGQSCIRLETCGQSSSATRLKETTIVELKPSL